MVKKSTAIVCLVSVVVTYAAHNTVSAQAGRDHLYIVGSSTVYPFSTVVTERFGCSSDFKTPKVESTGSDGGLILFAMA